MGGCHAPILGRHVTGRGGVRSQAGVRRMGGGGAEGLFGCHASISEADVTGVGGWGVKSSQKESRDL